MDVVALLKNGKVGVIPTDTLYGLVAVASNEQAVERVYAAKKRAPTKPCIILISDNRQLEVFGVDVSPELRSTLSEYWPGPVSVVLPCGPHVPAYLHRNTGTLAFRLPNDTKLNELLAETGPLIAPSANPEGLPPATTIAEAKEYFGDTVDFYVDGGKRKGLPSTIIEIDHFGGVHIIREVIYKNRTPFKRRVDEPYDTEYDPQDRKRFVLIPVHMYVVYSTKNVLIFVNLHRSLAVCHPSRNLCPYGGRSEYLISS